MNIIASFNDNPMYRGFVEPFCDYYKKLGVNVYLAYVGNDLPNNLSCTDLLHLAPIRGIDEGIQAKLARTFYAAGFSPNTILTFSDIDMFILNLKWYDNSVKKYLDYLLDGALDLVAFGANGYKLFEGYRPDIDSKWTIPYTTTTSRGVQKIFNTAFFETFDNFVTKFSSIENPIDGKESTSNKFNNFSDESLYRYMCMKNFARIAHVDIPDFHFQRAGARIDRVTENFKLFGKANFGENFWNQKELTPEQRKEILDGKFIDCWPLRPIKQAEPLEDILKLGLEFNNRKKA